MDKTSRRKQELMVAMDNRKKQKTLTVEIYKGLKKQKVIDARIMEKYGFNTVNFTKWKHDNGLIVKSANRKPQQAVQSTIEDKGDECMSEGQSAVEVDYKAMYEKKKRECENLRSVVGRKNDEVKRLTDLRAELEEKLAASTQTFTATDAQQEIFKLAQENERLKNYESDYRNLEIDYRNLHTENERLKRMLDRLKHTETMNVMLMEQRVHLQEQLDEVMA